MASINAVRWILHVNCPIAGLDRGGNRGDSLCGIRLTFLYYILPLELFSGEFT